MVKKNKMRFKALAYKYLDEIVGVKPQTIATYANCIDTHLVPRLGNMKVKDITRNDSLDIMRELQELGRKPSTINKIIVILKTILLFAVDNEIIKENPIKRIKELKVDRRSFPCWSEKEANEFLVKARGHKLFHIVKFGLNTGLRRGEMCGLQWKNVLERNDRLELEISEQMLPGRIRGSLKGFDTRSIPLSEEAQEVLRNIGRKGDNDYVFMLPSGKTIEPNWLSIEFRLMQEQLGINNSIKLHGLRHTFASLLTSKNINLQKIQRLLGHRDFKTTERYAHVNHKDLIDTVGLVSIG